MKSLFLSFLLLAPISVSAAAPTKQVQATQWQKFSSLQGKFIVFFPDSPKMVSYRVIEEDPPIHFYGLVTQPQGITALTINHFDVPLPKNMTLKQRYYLLDESWKSAYGRFKAQSIYKRRIKHGGHPAIEHRQRYHKDPKFIITGRYISVGNRVYHLFTAMMEPQLKAGYASKFMNSFKIIQ